MSNPLSGAALSLFFQESRDDLRKVVLSWMALSEDQCLALGTMSRLDVELDIRDCSLVDGAAELAFQECLQSGRGPVNLEMCRSDSRVARLKPRVSSRTNDADMAILIRALANNTGLVEVKLQYRPISDDNWSILCESLKAHPTLTSLDLSNTRPRSPVGVTIDEQKTRRTRVLVEMMQQNTVLHTIHLSERERDEQIYTEEIHPYLETNRYRPRVLAVNEQVLGRAVYSVRSNPNLVWMLLSENVDAFVRSEEEEESNSEVLVAVAVVVAVAGTGSKRKR
jgi:hypothetical protein